MSRSDADELKIFCGRASRDLCHEIATHMDLPVGQGRTEMFSDGELIVKIDEDVRGRHCYVVQSTHHPVNAHIMELLIYIDTLKRASAKQVTAVIPYFGYARQDRKDEGRVPITAKLVANLITAAGADRVVTMDLHAPQIQGFFDLPVDHLHASPVICEYIAERKEHYGPLAVVSPDIGNAKMANSYAKKLGGDLAIVEKRRKSGTEVESANLIGDVEGKTCLLIDDMISTAGTMCKAAEMLMERGATRVLAACTHAVLVGMAMERLAESPIETVIVTNTIPIGDRCKPIEDKLVDLSVAPLLGEAIHRIHHNKSISSLFRKELGGKR